MPHRAKPSSAPDAPTTTEEDDLSSSRRTHRRHKHHHQQQEQHQEQQQQDGGSSRGHSFMANLRRGYQLMKELFTPGQGPDGGSNRRRSQLPCRLVRFSNPADGWEIALKWLAGVLPKLILSESSSGKHRQQQQLSLPAPQFDKHSNFQGFDEFKALTPDDFNWQPDAQLKSRIIRLLGSGDALRLLAESLAPRDLDGHEASQAHQPRQDLLQLPLSYETALSHHHHHHRHHHNPLMSGGQHSHHQQHQHHLPPDLQAALNNCEANLTIFHRFLASLLSAAAEHPLMDATAERPSDSNAEQTDGGDVGVSCELRVVLGQQCAECNAVNLLLRDHQQQQHHHQQHQQHPVDAAATSASLQSDSALSVLLLHLLTLMLTLGELESESQPISVSKQLVQEILQLWDHRLKWPMTSSSSGEESVGLIEQVRKRYANLTDK